MQRRQLWLSIAIVAGFLGWDWHKDRLLWNAAKTHYLAPVQRNASKFAEIAHKCDNAAINEDVMGEGKWMPELTTLQRGFGLDPDEPSLAWPRDYQFYLVLYKFEGADPTDISGEVSMICKYDTDNRFVMSVYNPFY